MQPPVCKALANRKATRGSGPSCPERRARKWQMRDNTESRFHEEIRVTTLVFSYAHADEGLRNELEKHLSGLQRLGLIQTWHDRRIIAGQDFAAEIDSHFEAADVILLLISPDFIASEYCYNIEMTRALERHQRGEAVVIPVILRPCHWHALPFGKLLAATIDGKPVTHFPSWDDAFYQVAEAIKRAIATIAERAPATGGAPAALTTTVIPTATQTDMATAHAPRSSNLRIRRHFTDRDRDQARRDGYQSVSGYFETSLAELKERNPDIDIHFERTTTQAFEASIYVEGKRECHCGVWLGTSSIMGGDIGFSFGGVTPNSFNETISLTDDGYTMGFRPLGMAFYGAHSEALLTPEGAAEYLWSIFIRPLQP